MQISLECSKQARRALGWAVALGAAVALLWVGLAAIAIAALDTALPAGRIDALQVWALLAGATGATIAILESVRRRILLRAGLWLHHTAGQRRLTRASSGDELQSDLRALGQVEAAFVAATLATATDLPWALLGLVLIFAIQPGLGAIAAVTAVALLTIAVLHARRTRADRAAVTRFGAAAATCVAALTGDPTNTAEADSKSYAAEAAAAWIWSNQRRIVATYAAATTADACDGAANALVSLTLAAIAAGAAGMLLTSSLTHGALAALALLVVRTLAVVHRVVRAAPAIATTRRAWRQLTTGSPHATQRVGGHGFTAADLPPLQATQMAA